MTTSRGLKKISWYCRLDSEKGGQYYTWFVHLGWQVNGHTSDGEERRSSEDNLPLLELKNEKGWDEWKRITIPTIYSHSCENVINPKYVPRSHSDKCLFREQQNFMYSVFVSILMTNMGRHYVRLHEKDRNAQKVWLTTPDT